MLAIRSAHADDLPTLLEFEQGIVQAERPYDPTLRPGEIHYYDLAALLQRPDTRVVVADDGGRIVGSGYAQIRSSEGYVDHERHAFLGFMFVVPEARGQGINKRVVDALAAWAQSRGVTELVLEVYAGNHRAVRAYEKVGFEARLVQMRRRLGP